ncbi:hypothetical protein KPL70_002220 [Citrus sinensis]|uniref:Uncharacterized protein n=2 Tax=Citrus TaxID=2706 RepID=V4RF09_CITCL|nr:uncharacterized protein LOC18032903 isoform X1 [Citrus x clementina]XP_006419200.1 uncharacterized protein LOC18032903 isoform X1 [Citrus x clementina]XP_006488704.1 uncharacterized protein LOC102631300 isoform X1 [Citrus sinensis]XP_006488705.1 uncharacterized protein LOC102631300 isoform X1 [Citrus sinensis]XP_006488707.1 uncharacterized protein LOC102631300 isoform X1 [Citrus sinensis]XP_006488708.1 uncharacterized protein LOC102631300 isoform X1 [Citrus sinensis]XP_024045287.1 uncharac
MESNGMCGVGVGSLQLQPSIVSKMSINHNQKLGVTTPPLPNPTIARRRRACSVSSSISSVASSTSKSNNTVITPSPPPHPQMSSLLSSSSAPPFINAVNNPPELALLSLLFVLSMAIGAIFSLAIISIPTMIAFKKLADSADKLSKIVSEEVPGTLSLLKLSGFELNELTQQLTNLRLKISGTQYAKSKTSRSNKPTSSATRNYPIVD